MHSRDRTRLAIVGGRTAMMSAAVQALASMENVDITDYEPNRGPYVNDFREHSSRNERRLAKKHQQKLAKRKR